MYAKLFSSLYQGTLRGCADEILVFTNLLAHADSTGVVDKHWRAIAEETGISQKRVKAAIIHLESPDPESRSPEMDGRRIIPIDEHRAWGWQIVNFGKYREIKNEDDRREQNRIAQQKWREKQKVSNSKPTVSKRKQQSAESAQVEVEEEVDIEEEKEEEKEEERQSAKPDSAASKPKARKSRKKLAAELATRPDLLKNEYLAWLSAKPENEGVDVRKIFNDLLVYCKKQNETPTRTRLLNWVDRERKAVPMVGEVVEAAPKMTDAEKDAMFERQHYDRPLPKILIQ